LEIIKVFNLYFIKLNIDSLKMILYLALKQLVYVVENVLGIYFIIVILLLIFAT